MNFEEYFQRIGQAEQSVNELNQPAGDGMASSLPDYMPGIETTAEEHAPGWMRPALNAVRPEWEEKRNRWEELGAAALYGDFLKTGRQGELDARVQEVIGKNKVFRDFMEEGDKPLSRMYMGREVMRALYGFRFRDVPEMYFHSRGEQMPENGRKSLNDGYAAVWDDFSGKTRKRYADYQQKKAEFQRGLEEFGRELETALPEAVLQGKTLSPDMMEKATRYGQAERVTASLQRARAAVDLLRGVNRGGVSHGNHEGAVQAETEQILQEENKEGTSYRFLRMEFGKPKTEEEAKQQARANLGHSYEVTREFISHLVNVLSDEEGQLDEGALGAMMLALDADAQGQQTIDARFVRNMGEALKRWWANSDDFLRRYTGKAPFNEFLDVRNALTGGESFTLDEYLNKKQQEEDTHQRLYEDPRVEKLKAALSRIEDTRLSAADKAGFLAGSLTELGTITGDSAPAVLAGFASGGLSIAAFAPASMNRSIAQAHAEGRQNAELYGLITGGFEALAEGSFGVAVRKVPFVGKLMDKAAMGLIGKPLVGKAAAAVQSNWFLRYLGDRIVAESFGELVGEEVISQTGSYLTIQGLRGLGVDMDALEWKPFSTAWENIQDERQSAATVAFCAALGLMGLSADTRAAREFSRSRENLMTIGLTPETATKLAAMTEETMNQAALLQAGGDLNASKLRELDDKLQAEYRNAYQKEVVNEDPVKLRDRLKKNHDLFMSDVEAQVSLKEGVLKAALREQGVLDVEESLTGKNIVTVEDAEQAEKDRASWQDGKMPEGYETPVKKVEWTDDQLAAYSQYAIGNEGLKRMKAIRSAALNLDMAAKVDEKDYAKTLPLTESAVPVAAELARSKGAITIDALRALSEAAAKEGETGRNVLPGVSNATASAVEKSFVKRLQWEARSGNTSAASRMLAGEGGAAAIRLTAGDGPASRILYNPGHTLSTNLTEDVAESMLVDKMRREGGMDNQGALTNAGKEWLSSMHRDMQAVRRQVLAATGKDIMPGLEKSKPSLMNVAEYFSHLSQSAFYQIAQQYGLNDAAMRHVKFMDSALVQAKFLNDMGTGFTKWADTEAGRAWQKEGGTLAGLLRETGHELADLYTSSRITAENVAAVEEARRYRRANGTRTVEDIRAELEAAEQEASSVTPESELEARQPQEIPAEESVTGEAIPAEANEEVPDMDPESGQFIPPPGSVIETDPEGKGRGLEGGRYAEDSVEGSVIGMVPFSSLEFSKLPQAAHAAADGMAEVLRHVDGRMEVIMGGFMLRRRTQDRTVKVRVWDANAIHNEAWVRRRILEQAVLSGSADKFFDVRDFLEYYSGLSQAELPKNPFADRKLRALALLKKGEAQLVQDVIDGKLSWQDAYAAVETAATQDGQRFFLDQKGTDKKAGLKYLTALTRAYEAAPDTDMNILRKQASYVVATRKEIRKTMDNIDIKYSRGWKSVAEEEVLYGISLSTMKEFLDAMKRLRLLDASFDAFESDLDIPGHAAEWDGKAPVFVVMDFFQAREKVKENRETLNPGNPDITFSVTALDGDGTVLRPEAFITRPDGNPDWFTIPKRKGQPSMPVRLLVGEDTAFHKGYGLTHIAASRDSDGLWAKTTPERFLSSILANVSELWEISPGRELLVKGKKPSAWMVLQLARKEGYYSIVTAHPVAGSKKPNGKKLPLAERIAGKNQTRVDRSQRPANPDAIPGAFPGGQENETATLASTAGGGDVSSLPPGARVVNINDVRLRFDDGRQMQAGSLVSTMSLALMDDGLDTAPHLKERVVQQLIGDVRTAVRRFNRVFAGSTSTESAARELGQAQALLGMINKYAAKGYRPRLAAQMRYVEVYARMLESGKILSYGKLNAQELEALKEDLEADLADAVEVSALGTAWETATGMEVEGELKNERMLLGHEKKARQEVRDTLVRDYAGRKLDEVVRDMLNQGAAQLEKQLKDEEIARIGSLLDFLRPKKDAKTGKLKKGLMNADAYRRVARITRMMEAPAEKKAEEMERLNHQLAADELAEADHDRISLDLLDWSAYGALESMSLDAVRAAGESLRELVLAERNVWESRLEDEKNRLKKVAMDAAVVLGRADATKILRMKEKEEKAFRKFGVIGRHLMSFSQAMYAMSGMPGVMKELARETLDAVADGHVILTAREKAIMDQLEGFMKDELGLKKKRQRADFIQGLKKTIKTGIVREKVKIHSLDLTVEEAQRWLSMRKDERQAERDRLREEAESKGWTAGNMVEEDDLLPLKDALNTALNPPPRIDGKKGRKRERVQVRREWMEKQVPLEASADQLLNVILTYEQPFYAENARVNGYTPEVLDALRRKVGADALAYGYKMRDLLSESGVAEEFERREGVPFPAQTNYWMSRFHDDSRINQDRDALDTERGTGTRYGMLIQRVDHRHEVDLSLGASNVFLAACAQQNNYLVMGRMTAKWRRLLANKEFAGALNQRLGDGLFASLKQMLDLLDGAGVMEAVTQRAIGSLLGMFQSAHAVSVLSAALTTIAKQPSALMHAAAFKSPARVIKQLLLDRAGAGRISFGEMLRKPFFQARFKDDRVFVELMRMGSNAKWTRMAGLSRVGMQALEHVDVWSNCASMTALYNLTWQDLEKENRAAAVPMTEEQMEEICDRTVKNALELVGQPQRLTQRSMMAALGKNNMWVRMNCYMGGEMLNKVGMTAAIGEKSRAEGDGVIKRFGKKMLWLSTMSGVEQVILMLLDLMRGNGPDDDELPEWLVYNAMTGLSGLGLLNTLPILGPTLEEVSGQLNKLITGNGKGFIKTGLLDDMLFNLGGWMRCVKKFSNADKLSGEEMALAIADTIRLGAAGTGLGRGVNSTMQWTSTLSGILQSCSAVGNMVRPFLQRVINEEKKEKKERRERARRW